MKKNPISMASLCKGCGAVDSLQVLHEFGRVPVAGYLEASEDAGRSAPRFEFALALCTKCWLVQEAFDNPQVIRILNERVYSSYQPTYSISSRVKRYIDVFLDEAIRFAGISPGSSILEIGANDGHLLKMVQSRGYRAVGFEPSPTFVAIAKENRLDIVEQYFTAETAEAFRGKHRAIELIISRHTLEHSRDPVGFLRGMNTILAPNGLAVLEVPYVRLQMINGHFEAMTFQHVSYFSLLSISNALSTAGLALVRVAFVDMDGGSMVVYVRKASRARTYSAAFMEPLLELERIVGLDSPAGFESFFCRVDSTLRATRQYLSFLAEGGKRVLAYGAGSKGQSLLNLAAVDTPELSFVIDDVPANKGKFVPGTGIQVIDSKDPKSKDADFILLTAPTHIQEILEKEKGRLVLGTRFLATNPELHLVVPPMP